MNKEEYILKYLDGELSGKALEEFKKTEHFEFLHKIDASIHKFSPPEFDVDSELSRLYPRLKSDQKSLYLRWMQIAAAVAVLIVSVYLFTKQPDNIYKTKNGEKISFLLPDSSSVTLNASSSLSFDDDWSKNRQVNLKGEAYFQVKKGKKFTVNSNSGTVRVLGTKFNVRDRKEMFEIQCFEGKVKVVHQAEEQLLSAMQTYSVISNEIKKGLKVPYQKPLWLNNESSFINVPVSVILEEIELQYDVTVINKNIDIKQNVTCKFSHDNLKMTMDILSGLLDVNYNIEGDKITISEGV